MTSTAQEITITCDDGFPLAATLFRGASACKITLVVASALGVPRKYYAHFARHLTNFNISTITFDYRGFGGSGPAWRPDAAVSLTELGRRDLMAALAFAHAKKGASELCFVGHSFGMMVFALAPNASVASRAISIATGNAYYRLQPFPRSLIRLFLWSVFVPRVARLHGFFPGRMFGILGDIPPTIAADLAKYCRNQDFLKKLIIDTGAKSANFTGDILALSFTDDEITTPAAVDDFHTVFAAARITRLTLNPKEVGRDRLGHLGAFALGCETLWNKMAKWLLEGQPAGLDVGAPADFSQGMPP